MESENVVQFLKNKSILITGATGFLAKVLMEKILRIQPNVKKLYLLLRATDAESATIRFHDEVLGKDLFRVLKEAWSTQLQDLNSFIAEKITVVPGDISCQDLGMKDSNLKQKMWNELDIIINSAAMTKFRERYDVAFGINTLGVLHVVNFAKKCVKLKVLVHVSTAYVSGERSGVILENSYHMGETLNGECELNIDVEKNLVEQEMNKLKEEGASEKEITFAMKDLGIERAKIYGWPNTYVFTKAMGEMLVQQWKENLSVVTIRPTIISSTYKEPFPGWLEGLRTMDVFLALHAQGKLPSLLGDPKVVLDVMPVDMVVNAMIVAMVAHAKQPNSDINIYQVGSSSRNRLTLRNVLDYNFDYFSKNPLPNKDGKLIEIGKLTLLDNMDCFHRDMKIHYLSPMKGKGEFSDLSRNFNYLMRMVELYQPYLFFNAIFDDNNTEKLRNTVGDNGEDMNLFYFNPNLISWENYFMSIHIPGILKYAFK